MPRLTGNWEDHPDYCEVDNMCVASSCHVVICSITEHIHIFFSCFGTYPIMLWFLALFLRYCSWQPDTHTCLYLEIGTGSLQLPVPEPGVLYPLCHLPGPRPRPAGAIPECWCSLSIENYRSFPSWRDSQVSARNCLDLETQKLLLRKLFLLPKHRDPQQVGASTAKCRLPSHTETPHFPQGEESSCK